MARVPGHGAVHNRKFLTVYRVPWDNVSTVSLPLTPYPGGRRMGAWLVLVEFPQSVGPHHKGLFLTRPEAMLCARACRRMHPTADVTVGLLTEVQVYRPGDAMGGATD